jgi:hypothetical protein
LKKYHPKLAMELELRLNQKQKVLSVTDDRLRYRMPEKLSLL